MAAYVSRQMAVMKANGTLHGPASQGGFEVPKAQFRTSGLLTNAGGKTVSEYRRLVLDESKAEKAADTVRAESRQAHLSRSISRAESDVELLQSELSGSRPVPRGRPGSRPRTACAARTVAPSSSARASSQRP